MTYLRLWKEPPNPPKGYQWYLMKDGNWDLLPVERYQSQKVLVHEEDFE